MNINQLIKRIQQKEKEGQVLDVSMESRHSLTSKVGQYADRFLESLADKKAYRKEGYHEKEWEQVFSIHEDGESIDTLLNTIEQHVDSPGLNPASGGHLGYIPGGGIYGAALGDYLAAVTNRYAGVFFASPGAVRMENTLIKWVGKLVGYEGNFGGNLTSGGSIANLIAISTARSAMKIKSKFIEKTVIYLNAQTHHSVQKAIRIAGLEECIVRLIDCDDNYQMQATDLRDQIRDDQSKGLIPFLVIANAGSTDTGAIDPLNEIAEITNEHRLWLHVDAAYGGFFLLTEDGQEKMKGIEKADSVILDPHKGLFLPYGLGMVLVRNVDNLLIANDFQANYMQDTKGYSFEHSPAELSPELSKHFRGLRMWLPLKYHGIEPFRACLEEKMWLARYFYERIKEMGFEVGPYPELSVVVFRMVPKNGDADSFNEQLSGMILDEGSVFISSTRLDGNFKLRFAALSFRTHLTIVDRLLASLDKFSSALTK